jgi:TonB family protein
MEWTLWDESKLKAVLAHELTHVRRGDWHFVLLAAFNKSIFWFHPLAWWLERRLTTLSEQASDEGALVVTSDAASYASVLLEVSTAVSPSGTRLAAPVVPMAAAHPVARRIYRVLTLSKRSSGVLPARGWLAVVACALPFIAAVGAAQAPPPPVPRPVTNIPWKEWVQDGFKTTAVEALVMEHQLTSDPHNLAVRGKLLSYYLYNADEDGFGKHALWVIQNHPDSELASHPAVAGDYYGGAKYREQKKSLWLKQAAAHSTNPRVLASAASFVQQSDPPTAERLWKRACELDPQTACHSELIAFYARMILADGYFTVGVNTLQGWPEANQGYTSSIRSELLRSNDTALIGDVGRELADRLGHAYYGGPDHSLNLQARETASSDAEALLKRAQSLGYDQARVSQGLTNLEEARKRFANPPIPRSVKPPTAPSTTETTTNASRIRVGGAVQNAKLRQSTPALYPPLARQARIQGVVRFQVVINTDGSIGHIQLQAGHPLLVAAATEAVKTWRYEPTFLNGVPVEVATEVDVNFSLDQ